MKKTLLILTCILLLIAGCGKKEEKVNLILLSWINEQDEARMKEHIKEFEKGDQNEFYTPSPPPLHQHHHHPCHHPRIKLNQIDKNFP